MKLNLALLLLLACACASAQLYPPDSCANNCGQYTGDCTACHVTQGKAQWFADYTYVCGDCSGSQGRTLPSVPFQTRPVDTVLAFLENLAVKRDPKLARLMAMTPEKHVALMERAVRLKLDGPFLGACQKAFKMGTLALLPGEIRATRERILLADSKR